MAKKHLLVALTTVRDGKRVRFAARSTQNLTDAEIEQMDALTKRTGKLHYREPVNESAAEDGPEAVAEELTDAQKFVDRNANEITDDEIASLSAEDRAAAYEAEEAGRNRKTVLERLAPVDDSGL